MPGPGSRCTSCAGYSAFFVTDDVTHTVYEDGQPNVTNLLSPVGVSYVAETRNRIWEVQLYVVDDATDKVYIYQKSIDVEPASFGRVKALFK
jgi:hypothetical protein